MVGMPVKQLPFANAGQAAFTRSGLGPVTTGALVFGMPHSSEPVFFPYPGYVPELSMLVKARVPSTRKVGEKVLVYPNVGMFTLTSETSGAPARLNPGPPKSSPKTNFEPTEASMRLYLPHSMRLLNGL